MVMIDYKLVKLFTAKENLTIIIRTPGKHNNYTTSKCTLSLLNMNKTNPPYAVAAVTRSA